MQTNSISQGEINQTEPAFRLVAECLYRHVSSGKYYGLFKRGGKQIRKSLKTKDRKLAERKLADLRKAVGKIACADEDANADFETIAGRWLSLRQYSLSARTISLQRYFIQSLKPFFSGAIRNVKQAQVEQWLLERGQNLSGSTFGHELETLRGVFDYARA